MTFLSEINLFFYKFNFYGKYFLELKFKLIYSIFLFVITFVCCYYYSNPFLYLFAKYLLLNMESSKFFFSHISQLFWISLKVSFIVGLGISFPFIIFNLGCYFISGMFFKEFLNICMTFFFFFFVFLINIYLIYSLIIPNFLNFFLFFNQKQFFFSVHFEAKFEEYFLLILELFIKLELLFLIPFILLFLNILNILKINFFFTNKPFIYINFFILGLLVSPPDLLIQFIYIGVLGFLFECFLFYKLFWKNFFY